MIIGAPVTKEATRRTPLLRKEDVDVGDTVYVDTLGGAMRSKVVKCERDAGIALAIAEGGDMCTNLEFKEHQKDLPPYWGSGLSWKSMEEI